MVDMNTLLPKITTQTRFILLRGEIQVVTVDEAGLQEVFYLSTQEEVDQVMDIYDKKLEERKESTRGTNYQK